jgi:hypothetical protein
MGQDDTQRGQGRAKSFGHPSARQHKVRKPFRKDAAQTAALLTEKPPRLEGNQNRRAATGHIPKSPLIRTVLGS